jgi:probable FeS assembly SUF system protein SufT
MVRIAGKDGDALGLEKDLPKEPEPSGSTEETGDIERLVWDRLRSCFDPEIPVNIVELGLIYECRVTRQSQGESRVDVKFTLTAPGCGMGATIKEDMESRIRALPGIKDVDVELVWDPPWNQSMMSERAKLQLGMV